MDIDLIGAKKIVNQMKDSAKSYPRSPSKILGETLLEKRDNFFVSHLPSYNNLTRTILRAGTKRRQPRNLDELTLLPEDMNINGVQFLQKDVCIEINDKKQRILIFTTDDNLMMLKNSPIWAVDGTFSVVPSIFVQLFTIHIFHDEMVKQLFY